MLNTKFVAVLPVFIAVNIAAVLVWLLHISEQSMALVLGIIAGGLVDLDHRLTGRLKNVFYTMCAFSLSSLAAQYFLDKGVWFIALMTGMTFAFTMLGALGQRYNTIAFGTLVVALYTTLTYLPSTPWFVNPLMILCGTLLYSLTAIIVYLFFPDRPVRDSLSKSFAALADYLDAKAAFFDPDDIEQLEHKQINLAMKNSALVTSFNACRTALFYRMRGQQRHSYTGNMIRYYFSAQDIHERANSSHFDYQRLAQQLKNSDLIFRIQRLLELQAQACRDFAQQLQQDRAYHYQPRLERAIAGLNQSFELYAAQQGNTSHLLSIKNLLNNLTNIDWQLRQLGSEQQSAQQERAQIHAENITGYHRILSTLRSHLTLQSQIFRHAVRLSLVVFACCALVELFDLQTDRGYWILLTAVFVCQPNYSATKLRLKQRILGTLLGVLVGSLLPYMTSTLEAKLGAVVISSTLFFFFRTNNYSFSTFFITIQVLASFDILGFNIYDATLPRLLDTLIGAGIAWLAVSYLSPDWKYLQLDKVARQAISSNARYLLHIVSQLQFGKGDDLKYRIARRAAHEQATSLSTTIANMNSEPKKYAAYLEQGFELLRLNSALLGYISALGAYRRSMQNLIQDVNFLGEFYPIAKLEIALLEQLPTLSTSDFEARWQTLNARLSQYNQQCEQNQQSAFALPVQQLNMIAQMLEPLYRALHRALHQPIKKA